MQYKEFFTNKGIYDFYELKKVVRFFFKTYKHKESQRMSLSEHPFGTIKRSMRFTHSA